MFQGLQEEWAELGRSGLAHDASATEGIALDCGDWGLNVGQQIVHFEPLRMAQVGVQGRQQRGAFQHDSHASMASPVNAALMALGLSEPSFQIQIVAGQVQVVGADEQPRGETGHRRGHLSGDGIRIVGQGLADTLEPPLAVGCRSRRRIQRGGYVADRLDVRPQRFLVRLDLGQSAVDATGQAAQPFLGCPFFAS